MNIGKNILPVLLILVSTVAAAKKTHCGYIPASGGASLYYEDRGEGEPVILLHGHSLDTRMWDKQFRAFSKHHRVIRFDFRGYGRSSEQTETFQFTHMEDLITVMDSLHIERAHIVGLSMGAFVASDLLALHPERIISCVLASGGLKTYKGPSQPMDDEEKARRDKEIASLKASGVEKMKRDWIEALISSGGSKRESMRKDLTTMVGDWTAWQPLHKEVRVIMAKDAAEVFYKTKPAVPTLIIDGDNKMTIAQAEQMKARGETPERKEPFMMKYLPNGRYLVLPDCGHMMNMERPELFNKAVLEFIGAHPDEKQALSTRKKK